MCSPLPELVTAFQADVVRVWNVGLEAARGQWSSMLCAGPALFSAAFKRTPYPVAFRHQVGAWRSLHDPVVGQRGLLIARVLELRSLPL